MDTLRLGTVPREECSEHAEDETAVPGGVPGGDGPPGQLIREFESSAQTIRNWVNQAGIDEGRREGLTTAEREELRRENRILREEKEILAEAAAWFAEQTGSTPRRAFGFVKANQASHSVRRMCGLLGVSPSGY